MSMLLKHAIDEAFARLATLYGREFTGKFDEHEADAVKLAWQREVAQVPNTLDAIAWALRNLPDRCPNAIQFRNLCKQAPDQRRLALESDPHAPVRGPTPEELSGLYALRDATVFKKPGKWWALDIVAAHAVGGFRGSTGALRMAREVAASVPHGTESTPEGEGVL